MGNVTAPDFRYNPFEGTFSAFGHGYGSNPQEVHTIPSVAPYFVYLNEIPRSDTPSTLLCNEQGGSSFTEVSVATPPASGQFRAIYGSDGTTADAIIGQGTIEFSSTDAGKIVEFQYYGIGAIIQNQFLNGLLDGEYGTPDFGLGLTSDGQSAGTLPPIGSILAIHPDVKSTLGLDSSIWVLCDGDTDLPTEYFSTGNTTTVPDLTDDVFLKGGSSYGIGGSNTTSHNHLWFQSRNQAFPTFYYYQTFNSTGTQIDFEININNNAYNGIVGSDSASDYVIGGDGGTGEGASYYTDNSSLDNRPSYFSVVYYMRIK